MTVTVTVTGGKVTAGYRWTPLPRPRLGGKAAETLAVPS